MRKVLFIMLLLFCTYAHSQVSGNGHLVGFESLGLKSDATPVQVCAAIPVGCLWEAYITNGKTSAWSGYHKFTGSVYAIKVSKEKCLLYRVEDNYSNSGWNASLSPTTLYMAQWSLDSKSPLGYTFTGFEPVNGKSESKMRNDGVAAMELVRTCESYEGVLWQYDSKHHVSIGENLKKGLNANALGFFTDDPVNAYIKDYRTGVFYNKSYPVIDCQMLIKMAIAGIPYQYSQYADKAYPYQQLNAYPWSIQLPNIWLYEMLEWCISSGYEIAPGEHFENLQAGDLVFFGAQSGETRNAQVRKVNHVAMFTGRWVADKGYTSMGVDGKKSKTIYYFPVYDKNGGFLYNDTTTLHPQTIEVFQSPDGLPNTCVVHHGFLDSRTKTTNRRNNIVAFVRLPLNTKGCWNNNNPWDNPANMIHTSGFDTGYRVDVTGDGKPFTLYISSLNQAGKLKQVGEHIVTDYMPYEENAYEIIPKGARLEKIEFFDALLQLQSSSKDAKYLRKYYSRTTMDGMQREYMYNGINQYKVLTVKEQPLIVYGVLKQGEQAIIDIQSGRIYTSEGSILSIVGGKESAPGMKVVYCPTGQETLVTWE